MLIASQPSSVAAATPAPTSIVNACVGVNLPPSVVTGILTPVLDGVLSLVSGTLNTLLGTAAAGPAVPLKPLASDGNAYNATTCVSQANDFTLTNVGGISIGGNQITGLGSADPTATAIAGELNSIAFGNGSSTATGALGSIALGTGSSITGAALGSIAIGNGATTGMANSVALGANTRALRGALAGYTGYGLTALQNSAGEVSIGVAGAERQLTNVAAGQTATDAVNVAQLTAVNTAVSGAIGGLQTSVAANGSAITGLQTNVGINNGAISTLQGTISANGTAIGGLQASVLANNGAITGLQADLATNGNTLGLLQTGLGTLQGTVTANGTAITGLQAGVAANLGNIATLQGTVGANGTAITGLQAGAATADTNIGLLQTGLGTLQGTVTANGTAITGLQAGVAANLGSIATLQGTVTANGTAITGLQAGAATTDTNIGLLQTGLGTLQGTVATNSGDIATIQAGLGTLQTTVSANGTAISGLQGTILTHAGDIATLQTGLGTLQTSVGNNGTAIANLQGSVAANSGDIASIQAGLGTLQATNGTTGTTLAGLQTGLASVGANVTALQTAATNTATTLAQHSTDITANADAILSLRNDTVNGAIGPVHYTLGTSPLAAAGTPTNDVALVGGLTGAVGLHNVANGAVTLGSTDAVNGGQLFTLSDQLGSLENVAVRYDSPSHTSISLGGSGAPAVALHNLAIGALTLGSTDAVTGAQLFETNGNLATLSGRVDQNDTDITDLQGQINLNGGSLSTLTGQVATNTSNIVTNTANIATNTTDIANNITAIDNQRVQIGDLTTTIGGQGQLITQQGGQILVNADAIVALRRDTADGAIGPVQYTNPLTPLTPNGGTKTNDLTLVGQNAAPVKLHNVADGIVATGSTDAVNGGQLFALGNQIGFLSNLSVQYDDASHDAVSLGGSGSAPVLLRNVLAGTLGASSTEAVNGAELFATNTNVAGNTSDITNLTTTVSGQTSILNQQTIDTAANTDAIAALRTDTSNGAIGPVQYSNVLTPAVANGGTPTNSLTLVGANAAPVSLHNVANGAVSVASTDAVNGSQLFAVQNQIGSISDLAVQYDDRSKTRVSLGTAGTPVVLANVANGSVAVGSTEAVNGGQLAQTNQSVLALQTNVDNQSTQIGALNTAITNTTTTVDNTSTALTQLTQQVSNGGVGPVQYSDAASPTTVNGGTPSQDLTLVGVSAGPVGLHNVAAGGIGAGSTDAVNGSQIFGLGTSVASLLGGNYSYNPVTNSFSGALTYGGASYSNIQSVLGAIQTSVELDPGTTATASKYFHTTSVMADSQATGQDSTAIGPTAVSSGIASVALGRGSSASGDSSVAIGDGATAQDGKAVSIGVGNLASGDGAVSIGDPNAAMGEGATALGKDNSATGDGAIAMGNTNVATGIGAAAIGFQNQSDGQGAAAIGYMNNASGDGAIAIGSSNVATGAGSLAIGTEVATTATDTLAIGNHAAARGESSITVGNRSNADGISSSAVGDDASATGDYSSAFGASSLANGVYSTAVGLLTVSSGVGGTAVGAEAESSGFSSSALGSGSIADQDGSVALGAASRTTRGAVASYAAFGLGDTQSSGGEVAIARSISYLDVYTGLMTPTGDRQITGLAAGSADTDAVNVSQLRGVSGSLGGSFATYLGGGATYNTATGTITAPSYTLLGTTYGNVGDALLGLANRYASIGTGTTAGTTTNPPTGGDTGSSGGAGNPVHIDPTPTDTVTGTQLATTNQAVTTLATQVQNGAVGVVQYADATNPTTSNGGTRSNDATLVGADASAPVALHNVADGTVAPGSTDAVNGGQLAQTNAKVETAQSTANTALAMGQNSVQYDSGTTNSVTLGSTSGGPVALHNVADATSASDAVNLGQVQSAMSGAVAQSNAYTDQRVAQLSFDLAKVHKDANAGTAGAMALASMPQPYEAGKGMISMGMATYQGQTAVAAGVSKAMDDGRTVMKLGATYDTRHHAGASIGIGYQI